MNGDWSFTPETDYVGTVFAVTYKVESTNYEDTSQLTITEILDPANIEDWQAVAKTTETVNIQGVCVEQITSMTFQRPNGARIKLITTIETP